MKNFPKALTFIGVFLFVFSLSVPVKAATSPDLADVNAYSVLAGSIVTNSGSTTMNGSLGISPSIGVGPHFTGFPPGLVNLPGTIHDADANAGLAQLSNTAAFGFIDQPCTTTYAGVQDLGGLSLVPGVYCATGAFTLTGNLTLAGSGVWIFKSDSTLITASGASVTGGDPCNVWWRVASSATIETGTSFTGNILALTSITMNTGASLTGRALTQTGAVTLEENVITTAICAAALPTVSPTTRTVLTDTSGVSDTLQNVPWNGVKVTFLSLSVVSILLALSKRKNLNAK